MVDVLRREMTSFRLFYLPQRKRVRSGMWDLMCELLEKAYGLLRARNFMGNRHRK